ncbi:MAG TPA: RNA polymerase sigma factor [Planctomycetota bacterium]|jgi:RNA polymerase sigma-70 factor (ECF subfamily)|nr:RNA polymerase sigma factor [Planctomycetota bacterium]
MAGLGETAETAFGERLEGLRGPVFEFLRRLTRDYQAAEDLTQEIFLRALLVYRAGTVPQRLSGWIFRVAYRAALDGMRRSRRLPTYPIEAAVEGLPQPEPDSRTPGQVVIEGWPVDRDRALEEVRGAIFALPERTRELFLARYGTGRSCREAATLAGISSTTARVRMLRGRRWIAGRVTARLREERKSLLAGAPGEAARNGGGERLPAPLAPCANG